MNILIVEDNEINRRVASKVVASLGHTVATAENGLEAVEAAELTRYDAILMDVQMPVMDGLEASRRIRSHTAKTPPPLIIAVTANAVIGDREACLTAGMDDYLTKPLRIEPLRAALSKVRCDGASSGEEGLIDQEQLCAIVGDSECLEIFKDFCQLGAQQIEELTEASLRKDWKQVGQTAHQLKGSSSTFGFITVSKIAGKVEAAARETETVPEGSLEEMTKLFTQSVESAQPLLVGLEGGD